MEMKEPGGEIRGGRWDVKHYRRGWRILRSAFQTTQHTGNKIAGEKTDLDREFGRENTQMDSVKDRRMYLW